VAKPLQKGYLAEAQRLPSMNVRYAGLNFALKNAGGDVRIADQNENAKSGIAFRNKHSPAAKNFSLKRLAVP
jgi:hypothetical protein